MVLKWSTKDKVITNDVKSPGLGIVGAFSKGNSNKIILEYKSDSNAKGIIWMNPSINEIKVDLKQAYQWKYGFTYFNILKSIKSHSCLPFFIIYLLFHLILLME